MKEYEENKAQNEEEDEMVNVVTLNDEDGNEQDFEYIDSVEYEGKEYGFFLPMEEDASAAKRTQAAVEPLDVLVVELCRILRVSSAC